MQNGRKFPQNGRKFPQTAANPKRVTNPFHIRAGFRLSLGVTQGTVAMLSRQWSSNTLKDGIDLLSSQSTDAQENLKQIDEMIKAHWH